MSTATYGRGAENLVSPQTVSKITNALTIYATSNMECWKKVREKSGENYFHPVETLYLQFLFITMLNEGDERVSAFREKIHFSQENGPFLPLLPPIWRMILVAGPSMVLEFIMFKMTKQCG